MDLLVLLDRVLGTGNDNVKGGTIEGRCRGEVSVYVKSRKGRKKQLMEIPVLHVPPEER